MITYKRMVIDTEKSIPIDVPVVSFHIFRPDSLYVWNCLLNVPIYIYIYTIHVGINDNVLHGSILISYFIDLWNFEEELLLRTGIL